MVNDWKKYFDAHTMTDLEALKLIKDNDRVIFSHACVEPSHLINKMVENASNYHNVEIIHMVGMGKMEYCQPQYKENFHHNSFFAAGGKTKTGLLEGYVDVIPASLSQVGLIMENNLEGGVDVYMGQCTPPNKHGYVSLGPDLVYEKHAIRAAKTVIMQVNPNLPKAGGDAMISVEEIDSFVYVDEPIIELPRPKITDIEMALGKNCADLIEDGSTLQLGIGSLPDAVCLFLKDKKDLGIHSEMISDGVMELMKAGVVNNSKKTLHPGKTVIAFAMGTKEFYDFLDDNPDIEVKDASYVNDSHVISLNDKMISINSCVEMNFYGEAASESIGTLQISGTGGQTDFVRGAVRSKGGKSLMVFASTAVTKNGKKSKIVPMFEKGTPITTPRTDIDYAVTEYGVAALRGKNVRERGIALIKIANPEFHEELIAAWEEMFHQTFPREELGK